MYGGINSDLTMMIDPIAHAWRNKNPAFTVVTRTSSQKDLCLQLNVLVSSNCCPQKGNTSKLLVETFLKRGLKGEEKTHPGDGRIRVVLAPVKFGDNLVPNYTHFRATVNLSQHWLIGDEPVCIRYRYVVEGKKESYPSKDVKKRICFVPKEKEGTFCHYDFPIYKHDELENTNPEVNSLIDDLNVTIAVRDAQLTYLTFLPHMTGGTATNHKRVLLENAKTTEIQEVIDCLLTSARSSKRMPQQFNPKEAIRHHLLSEISLPQSYSLFDIDIKQQIALVRCVCKLINDNKVDVPLEEQQKMCSQLLIPSDMNKQEVIELINNIESSCSDAGGVLQAFIQSSMPDDWYGWLQLLPLIHFIRKDCEPFGNLASHTDDSNNLRFWGVQELDRKNTRDRTKIEEKKNDESFQLVLATIHPLFKMDPLLIRSCLWLQLTPGGLVKMMDNEQIAVYVETSILGSAMIKATEGPISPNSSQDLLSLLDTLSKRIERDKDVDLNLCKTLTENILENMTTSSPLPADRFHVVYKTIDVFLAAFCKTRLNEIASSRTCTATKVALEDIAATIGIWLMSALPQRVSSEDGLSFSTGHEHTVWKTLFTFTDMIKEDEYKRIWDEQMKTHLRSRIWNKLPPTEMLLIFCHDKNAQKFDGLVDTSVKAVDDILRSTDPIPADFQSKMSGAFIKKYQSSQSTTGKDILWWSPLPAFFQIRASSRADDLLSADCLRYLNLVWMRFESFSKEVIEGSVTINDLTTLVRSHGHTSLFLELYLCQLIDIKKPPLVEETLEVTILEQKQNNRGNVERLLDRRRQELDRLELEKELNENLRRVCDDLGSVNTSDIEEKLTRLSRQIRLDEVLAPAKLGSNPQQQIDKDESCFFDHPKVVQDILRPLRATFKCSLFHRALQKKARDKHHERQTEDGNEPPLMTIEEMATTVWQPVYKMMRTFVDELREGSIHLFNVDEMLKHLRDDPEKLKEEIEKLFAIYGQRDIRTTFQNRCDEIIMYFQLKHYNTTAAKILELKDKHGLKGDFAPIQLLLDLNKRKEQGRTLADFSKELQHLSDRLETVARYNQLKYLEDISDEQSKELLTWIRKEIDDLKELEVFVDLAAGDSDGEFATVLKFHHAATGHAAFIFDFKERCDCKLFLDVVERLASAYAQDTFLLSYWNDTKANLTRLVQIRKNMDSSPLQQAELINEKGVYIIGKHERDQESRYNFSESEKMTLVEYVADHIAELFGSNELQSQTKSERKTRDRIIHRREWRKAAATVLNATSGQDRGWLIVQRKWRDMCIKAKDYEAHKDDDREPELQKENPIYEKVLQILQDVNIDGDKSSERMATQATTDTLASLRLEVDMDGRTKVYSKEDLQDLQSKLSLVVGKSQQESKDGDGKRQMEYFVEVFNAMQQLATTYNKLCSAGNTLFLEWKATFQCDYKRDIRGLDHTVCMDFGVDDKLYGTRSLTEELPDLLEFMNKCLERWKSHVDEKRNKYYYLNYFTTEQLLRLCHDLACQSRYPDRVHDYTRVFALLSSVTHEYSWKTIQASLKSAMSSATKEILQESQESDDTDETQKDIKAARRQQEQELATRLAAENLMDETLVLAAIHALGTDKEDEDYITWCLSNPAGNKGEKPIHSVTKSWKDIVSELLATLTSRESSLDVLLSELWENYLQSVKCVDSEEYLSLDYVGLILKYLAINATKATTSGIGWTIQNRSGSDSDGLTTVSPDQKILCPGQLTTWRYQCHASHSFSAIVWRQVANSSTHFKIVGINIIPASEVGVPVTYQVPEEERISVQPGDVIGWSSGKAVLACNVGGGYQVRWLGGDICSGLEVDQIYNINSDYQDREYSIEATIERDTAWISDNVFVYLKNRHRLATEFHSYFKENRPNIVVCKDRDVLTTVLSLYRGSTLPTPEEILICCKDTTVEEVSLLWRRAIADTSNQRVFCLVHAERLEYSVSVDCANLLHELTQKPTGCRLVIVCSQEEEHRAHMVTKLDQHRVELPNKILSTRGIKHYLGEQFQQRAQLANLLDEDIQENPETLLTTTGVQIFNSGQSLPDASMAKAQTNKYGNATAHSIQNDGNQRVKPKASSVSSFLSFAESSMLTMPFVYDQETSQGQDTDLTSILSTSPGHDRVPTGEFQAQTNHRSTVQAIRARRSGVGKSSIITNYVKHLRVKYGVDQDAEMLITIPLHDKVVDKDAVVDMLLPHLNVSDSYSPRIIHIDVAPMVHDGLDDLLFNLLVLGKLVNKRGYVWTCQPTDLLIIEITELPTMGEGRPWFHTLLPNISCYAPNSVLEVLRKQEAQFGETVSGLDLYGETLNIDAELFQTPVQCAYQYLDQYTRGHNLCNFNYNDDEKECSYRKVLSVLLQYCGVSDPTWSELRNFAHFLSAQLRDCERSNFCQFARVADKRFSSFKSFVVELMMMMARDFSTPSLDMSDMNPLSKQEERSRSVGSEGHVALSPSSVPADDSLLPSIGQSLLKGDGDVSLQWEQHAGLETDSEGSPADSIDKELACFQLKRRWEKSFHPYLFFNEDHDSFTFMGFILDELGNLIPTGHTNQEQLNGHQEFTTCHGLTLQFLLQALEDNDVNLSIDFDDLRRADKLLSLYRVLGIAVPPEGLSSANADPDTTYKLTADNVMKMLAIYMRFRCKIPVVIMGETGCGKTRLIQYLCRLLAKKGSPQTETMTNAEQSFSDASGVSVSTRNRRRHRQSTEVENLVMMKVHGGTTMEDIIRKVELAEEIALSNQEKDIDTVLFLDEANTTEAMGLIKEVMCDGRIQGRTIENAGGCLNIIAACNPYRRHTPQMIFRMKQSGLGYRVAAEKTTERFGSIPLRELVYRVQPIPPSIRPLVWDFGTLSSDVEQVYIKQIVEDYNTSARVRATASERRVIVSILSGAQEFMKNEKNECSFVSLRDVTRCMDVVEWFLTHADLLATMYEDQTSDSSSSEQSPDEQDDDNDANTDPLQFEFDEESLNMTRLTRALVLALGVCYHARLQQGRQKFREHIAAKFHSPCVLAGGPDRILDLISGCQDEFLRDVDLGPNIAPNAALKENIFLMVICIELRIPLFIVGKPGSSKSLAKSIVAKAMQGAHSKSPLYRALKQVHMLAFQCSPLTTSADILHAFERCNEFQKEKITQNFVSVVVLDEIGLAEDSPKMPLKTLHPLLEPSSVAGNDSRFTRVGFIGLSNWALDPAKMNRGIMVSREDPTERELIETAKGICNSDQDVLSKIQDLIPPLAQGYQIVCTRQSREFFGLRDYYSLIKMVYGFAKKSDDRPTAQEMEHCIKRNFDGFNEEIETYEIFLQCFKDGGITLQPAEQAARQPDCSQGVLLEASMDGIPTVSDDARDSLNVSRYLLVLTENFAALPIIEKQFADQTPEVIFGSSFPNDQEYTQVCRDINSIKICMEAGRTVILLNFDTLYESLYDALNQYYSHYKTKRFVSLGIGTHRVKCKVHHDFRLIVIADKTDVYEHFPTPLINRLEKHFLSSSTMLSSSQQVLVTEINQWVHEFSSITLPKDVEQCKFDVEDAFVGYHQDLVAKLVFQTRKNKAGQLLESEAMIRARVKTVLLQCATPEAIMRLPYSNIAEEFEELFDIYFSNQKHSSLKEYLLDHLKRTTKQSRELMLQVTTHSRLLVSQDLEQLEEDLELQHKCLKFLYLHSFQTQQQCRQEIRHFMATRRDCERILIVQCEDGHRNNELLACASYCIVDEITRAQQCITSDDKPMHVILLINLARMDNGFVSYHGGPWEMVHIDDVRPPRGNRPEISSLMKLKGNIRSVFEDHEGKGEVNAERLLMDSLHLAIQRIDVEATDEDNMRKQISRQISTIRDIIDHSNVEENEHAMFVRVTKIRIADLLRQRDQETGRTRDVGMRWLMKKALEISSIHESGTFRRALWQQLINTIYPILAEVIAFSDYNNNLQLLDRSNVEWIRSLWLAIYGDLNLAPQHYTDMISPTESHIPSPRLRPDALTSTASEDSDTSDITNGDLPLRETIPIKVFGNNGKPFTAVFPFSWLIKKFIDQRYQIAGEKKALQKSMQEHVMEDAAIAVEQHLGSILTAAIPSGAYQKCVDAYLKDFIHMMYTCNPRKDLQNKELECVTMALKAAMIETGRRLEFDDKRNPSRGLVLLHETYAQVAERLKQFSKLINACPDLLEKHFHQLVNQENEMTLDVKAVEILVSHFLVPTKEACTKRELQQSWLNAIQSMKQLVQSVIYAATNARNSACVYGVQSQRLVKQIRPKWHRIRILEMFFLNMFTSARSDIDPTIFQMGLPVWNAFAGGTNMKSIDTIKRVKNLLENITKRAAMIDFKFGLECKICCNEASDPVVLDCKHVLCETCITDMFLQGLRKCPTCKKNIPQAFQPIVTSANRQAFQKFQEFKECRNAFFFNIVSQLCFADNTPPDAKVVEGLLKLVVGRSSDAPQAEGVTFNTDCIDHTPAIRVVLLRLLLQSSQDVTTQYIDRYLKDIKPATGEDLDLATEVCLMLFYCYEDFWFRETTLSVDPKLTLIEEATKRLSNATERLCNKQVPDINVVQSLAEARFGLITTAQFIHEISVDDGVLKQYKSLGLLFEEAQKFCLDTVCNREAHLFLLKNLCKSFGTDALEHVCRHEPLKWILNETLKEWVSKTKDVFVLLGDTYVNIRKGLQQTIQQESIDPLQHSYEGLGCTGGVKNVALILAIFRLFTLEYGPCSINVQIKEAVQEFIRNQMDNTRLQEMTLRLLENKMCSRGHSSCDQSCQLVVRSQDSHERLKIVTLVIHALVTVMCADDFNLCCPLKRFLKEGTLKPEELQFVAAIGKRYRVSEDESLDPDVRRLSFNVIMRAVMIGVAVVNPKMFQRVTKGAQDVEEKLWTALDKDIRQFEWEMWTRGGINLIHVVLARVAAYQPPDDSFETVLENYEEWESHFITTFIEPIIGNRELEMYRANEVIENDRTNTVMELLQTPEPMLSLADHRRFRDRFTCLSEVWRYKLRISLDHVMSFIRKEPMPNRHVLLREFFQMEPVLRIMKDLPKILLLQRRLIERFHRCIDAKEAEQLTPNDMVVINGGSNHDVNASEDRPDDKDIYQLMECFVSAWNQVWRKMTLPEEHQHSLDIDFCKLATFLPTASSESTELVEFLLQTHNDFIDTYCKIRNQENVEGVSSSYVTHTHLVAYDLDEDLLPLIQAHCRHQFDEEVTSAEFNLDSLERAVEETFVRGRPRIEGTFPKLIFREGSRSRRVFQEIRDKVKQERLTRPFKQDILGDLKSITDLCDCLAVVDIAIGFLVSTGGSPDTTIIDYLAEPGINLPKEQTSQITVKARHRSLKHILDLWQVLGVERAKRRLASEKQDPFEGIPERFLLKLTSDECLVLSRALRYMDVHHFISELYEYIEINLKTSNPEVMRFDSESNLFDVLKAYMIEKRCRIQGLDKAMDSMNRKKTEVEVAKAVDTWTFAVRYQAGKERK